jgi:beta-carotene 3-hydroxylase
LGIMFYGLCYFMIHDVLIHQRFKWFKHTNKYLIGLRKAHKVHHKHLGKEHGECFECYSYRSNIIKYKFN